jgi:hypothetical protein
MAGKVREQGQWSVKVEDPGPSSQLRVFPAKAGIQIQLRSSGRNAQIPRALIWTPAFAGDTDFDKLIEIVVA